MIVLFVIPVIGSPPVVVLYILPDVPTTQPIVSFTNRSLLIVKNPMFSLVQLYPPFVVLYKSAVVPPTKPVLLLTKSIVRRSSFVNVIREIVSQLLPKSVVLNILPSLAGMNPVFWLMKQNPQTRVDLKAD